MQIIADLGEVPTGLVGKSCFDDYSSHFLLIQNGIQTDIIHNPLCGEPASSLLALLLAVPQLEASSLVAGRGRLLLNIPGSAQMSPPWKGPSSLFYPKQHPLPIILCLYFSQTPITTWYYLADTFDYLRFPVSLRQNIYVWVGTTFIFSQFPVPGSVRAQ